MVASNELGILPGSEIFFSTPSDMAKKLFYYITRCGHYFCDSNYSFSSNSEIANIASRLNYLLFYVVDGSLDMEVDGKKYTSSKDQIAIIDCKKPHYYYAKENVEFLWIHLDGANAREFYEYILASKNNRQVFDVPENSNILRNMLKIIAYSSNSNGLPEIEHSQLIYKILCNLLFTPQNDMDSLEDESHIGKAVRYIDNNLFSELSVNSIAESVSLSYSHFSRLFKKQTGYSPHEYIVLKRIRQAKYLLNTTTQSVKEVAFSVGYNSEANFISSFISKVGISPSAFRKNPL